MGLGRKGNGGEDPHSGISSQAGRTDRRDQCGRMAWKRTKSAIGGKTPPSRAGHPGFDILAQTRRWLQGLPPGRICRGIPNFVGKAPCRVAMIFMGMELCITHLQSLKNGKDSSLSILIGPARCKKIVQKEEKNHTRCLLPEKTMLYREKKEIAWPPRDLGPKAKEKE